MLFARSGPVDAVNVPVNHAHKGREKLGYPGDKGDVFNYFTLHSFAAYGEKEITNDIIDSMIAASCGYPFLVAEHTMTETSFNGFTRDTIHFYRELSDNNSKSWFEANKSTYQEHVLEPAKAFILETGAQLRKMEPGVVYDTRTNGSGSLFRIYRDTRFSKDKSPYKTSMGILFWDGPNKKVENPGFYFHLDSNGLKLYTGLYQFPKDILSKYREAVIDDKRGPALSHAIEAVQSHPGIKIGWSHYKRVPRGYDPEHPRAELLKYNSVGTEYDCGMPDSLFSADLIDTCISHWEKTLPLFHWLKGLFKPG